MTPLSPLYYEDAELTLEVSKQLEECQDDFSSPQSKSELQKENTIELMNSNIYRDR